MVNLGVSRMAYDSCCNTDCEREPVRVITCMGGVASVCEEHADERLENNPLAVDQTEYFKSGDPDDLKYEPGLDALPPEERRKWMHEPEPAGPERHREPHL